MDAQVRVASLDAFQDFRAAFAKFGDASRNALIAVDVEIRRMLDWLEKDQVAYWKGEIRRCEEKLNEAKGALHRKRITGTFGNTVSDSEEILMVRRAQAKLAHAEEKLKGVKQWYLVVEQAVSEYRGPAQQLGNAIDAGVPRALSSLDRMAEILESYLAVATPGAEANLGIGGAQAVAAATGVSNPPVANNKTEAAQATPPEERS